MLTQGGVIASGQEQPKIKLLALYVCDLVDGWFPPHNVIGKGSRA